MGGTSGPPRRKELPSCDFFPRRDYAVASFSSGDGFVVLGGSRLIRRDQSETCNRVEGQNILPIYVKEATPL